MGGDDSGVEKELKKSNSGKSVTFKQEIRNLLEDNAEALKGLKEGDSKSTVRMVMKAPALAALLPAGPT